ncbi:MAG TPA: hypothetical protein VI541_04130 [Actinomycetota bacterium]|nr:hypothetical protein [Actinomycetota bacterium]
MFDLLGKMIIGIRVLAASPSPIFPTLPADAPPPGVSSPLAGVIAIVAILVVAVAGIAIYRVIRKGL